MDAQKLVRCLQFTLPSGAGGMAAQMAAGRIKSQLNSLCAEKKIPRFRTTHEKHYKMNVWFEDEKYYTVVFLLRDSTNDFRRPILVEKPITESPYHNGE